MGVGYLDYQQLPIGDRVLAELGFVCLEEEERLVIQG